MGKVVFHRPAGNVSVYWEPLTGESPEVLLTRYREALTNALEARLKAMDESPYWNLTPGEYDAFCAKYSRYAELLKGD